MDPHHAHHTGQIVTQLQPSSTPHVQQLPESSSASPGDNAKRGPGRPISATDNHDLKLKREKARDRQRRKRERDKLASLQRDVAPMETEGNGDGVIGDDGIADGGGEGGSGGGRGAGLNRDTVAHVLAMAIVDGIDLENMAPDKRGRLEAGLSSSAPISLGQFVAQQHRQHQHERLPSPSPALPPTPKRQKLHQSTSHSESSMSASGRPPSSLLVNVPEPPPPPTEEELKREKVRQAAKERQRKHRAMMKAKRMSQAQDKVEDTHSGQAGPPSAIMYAQMHPHPAGQQSLVTEEQVLYQDHMVAAIHAQAQMHAALATAASSSTTNNQAEKELPPQTHNESQSQQMMHRPLPPSMPPPPPSLPFPTQQPHSQHETPGQSFAKTMFLALACAPMLKPHMMKTLHMTDADFPAVEQVIASAWDHWDHIRRISAQPPAPPAPPMPQGAAQESRAGPQPAYHLPAPPAPPLPGSASAQPTAADYFRERFQRTLAQPSPYHQPLPSSLVTPATGSSNSAEAPLAPSTRPSTRNVSSAAKRQRKSSGAPSSTKPRQSKTRQPGVEGVGMMDAEGENEQSPMSDQRNTGA
ncbi:hypothetical protein FRB93_013417 [Tulasnella sp. JGI-2019a]|nr:hypothetical protein FRB93_013417 [Tulasnella sp. JGI-2019a]